MTGDPIWLKCLLAVHVTAGFGAFLLAPVALMTAKGANSISGGEWFTCGAWAWWQ